MNKICSIVLFCFFCSAPLAAQIQPPDFLCVRGDTLFWTPAVNTCGPFVGYEVWGSQSPSGPFSLLATITNPAQHSYFHVNPGAVTWYFYLLSNHNCPGQTALPSVTLDNRPPAISPILSVSVVNGNVLITWEPSPSPEVFAYVIYRETPIGVVPVDTIYSGNTYLDQNAAPDMQPESYFVNALDPCGNTSIFDLKHSTMYLEGTLNPCRQSIDLTWNLYENWPNGIGEHQIWAGINGNPPVLLETVGGNLSAFELKNLKKGDIYCVFVEARQAVTSTSSRSNEFCFPADIVQDVRNLFIKNVTVTPDNRAEVTWTWNPGAEINEIQILRSDKNADYQQTGTVGLPLPTGPEATFTDAAARPGNGPVFFRIQTRDACDSLLLSSYGATMHLSVEPIASDVNELKWTPLNIQYASLTNYEIFKTVDGVTTSEGTVDNQTTTFEDLIDPTDLAEVRACYHVVATSELTLPDGSPPMTIRSRSNTACSEQNVRILVPNAFAPDGFNQTFKPLIVLGDLTSYEMKIFDRYGQVVFSSSAPDDGWNGKKNGKRLPQDVYIYQILVTQENGTRVGKRGSVLLIR